VIPCPAGLSRICGTMEPRGVATRQALGSHAGQRLAGVTESWATPTFSDSTARLNSASIN
jgi:hypothetical protein